MHLGNLEFRPGRLPTAVTLVLLGVLTGLGLWQLERAPEKRALLEQWRARREAPPRSLDRVLAGKPAPFTPVEAVGRYDGEHQFLLDNQIRNQRPGFHVLTPLRIAGSDRSILVNRGWVPMGQGRSDLPELPVPGERVRVTGVLAPPPQAGIRLGAPDPGRQRWPKVIQYMVPERMADQVGYPVAKRVIRLSPEAAHGFDRNWEVPVPFGPERHVGYAVQWFALAVVLLGIYLAVNTKRRTPSDGAVSDDR